MKSQTPDLRWPDAKRTQLQIKIDRAQLAIGKLKEQAAQLDGEALIQCCHCEARHPINTQTYIQTHWYTAPHGCSGGDYWNEGEANWKCPDCGFTNRFDDRKDKYQMIPNDFYRPEIVALRYRFAKVIDCYCDNRYYNKYSCCDACKEAGIK